MYAHRGGAELRPENTIEAFDHGLSFGADGLEFDVHLSRDGVAVVHHDCSLERTTGGRGLIRAHDAAELGRLDAGYWFGPPDFPYRERGLRIPTLREVLARYTEVRLIIELKQPDPELARRTVDEVRAAGAIDRVVLGSYYWRALHAARAYDGRIPTGAAREETRWALYRSWVRWPLVSPAYREFQVPERSGMTTIVTPRFVEHAHRANLPVKVWTINRELDMRRLVGWGVDALISDRPDVAVRVVRGGAP